MKHSFPPCFLHVSTRPRSHTFCPSRALVKSFTGVQVRPVLHSLLMKRWPKVCSSRVSTVTSGPRVLASWAAFISASLRLFSSSLAFFSSSLAFFFSSFLPFLSSPSSEAAGGAAGGAALARDLASVFSGFGRAAWEAAAGAGAFAGMALAEGPASWGRLSWCTQVMNHRVVAGCVSLRGAELLREMATERSATVRRWPTRKVLDLR
mmetsp:Transcript_2028/g.4574  ORF Transcript_2028/g.4574 Transcript_2028/m.4574 type:complete len:207 (+) Transcript_2028:1450-2070(+)